MQNTCNQTITETSANLKSLCNDAIRQLDEMQRIVTEIHQRDLEIAQHLERMMK